MIRIVTDTASDINVIEAKNMKIELLCIPITFDEADYNQESDKDFEQFYNLLENSRELPKTSQVPVGAYLDILLDAKEKNDEVILITLSSGLSGTYNSARIAKDMSEYDKIFIIDSKQATVSQRILVNRAVALRDMGKSAEEIANIIENAGERATVCGVLNTLTYLKKGGRVPPAMSFIGNVLHIKPVIILKNKKLDQLGKAQGFNNGKKILYAEFEKSELDTDWPVYFGYTKNKETGAKFMNETAEKYNLKNYELYPIGGVIGTHLGPNCILISYVKK